MKLPVITTVNGNLIAGPCVITNVNDQSKKSVFEFVTIINDQLTNFTVYGDGLFSKSVFEGKTAEYFSDNLEVTCNSVQSPLQLFISSNHFRCVVCDKSDVSVGKLDISVDLSLVQGDDCRTTEAYCLDIHSDENYQNIKVSRYGYYDYGTVPYDKYYILDSNGNWVAYNMGE